MKNEQQIKKWLNDELTEDEKQSFEQSEDYRVLSKIWEGLIVATPPAFDLTQELDRFKKTRKPAAKVIEVSWHKHWVRIAASIVLIGTLSYFLFWTANDKSTTYSLAQTELYLPDSSVVVLNKGSEITYSPEKWVARREVRLIGEGYFRVKKGSKFNVVTSDGVVSVLGTSFNVKQRQGFYEVVCYEGKVRVDVLGESAELTSGKVYQYNGIDATITSDGKEVGPSWMKGKSSFYKTPFHVVIEELKNQYDITIETEGISLQNTFTGSFPNNNLSLALDAISAPSGFVYKITNDSVRISGEVK
jgi:transmembrane sensor